MTDTVRKSAEVKQSDAKSYDATAAEFGALTERYSKGIAERMLDLADVTSGDRLLDLGTGTGLLARLAAARGANAVGIDHSAGMLGQAQASADQDGVGGRTEFVAMDAEALDFNDEAFDVTVSLFVLRHLPNPLTAAREMHRTLKLGGRLVTSIGARPSLFSASGLGAASDRVNDMLGRVLLAPGSLREFLRSKGLKLGGDHAAHSHLGDVGEMLRSVGFRDVGQEWWGERHVLSAEEFWNVQAVFDSDARATLTALDDLKQDELKRQYIATCEEHVRRGCKLVYRTGALIFTATR
ncbi:MAG: methyltransferase domain-containing protein [Sphingomicrobium sp.]